MTVTAQTARSGAYNGNGITTSFDYTFKCIDEDDLVVTLTDSSDVETVQTITTHYTVTGVGVDAGGTVEMVTAPASGEKLTITRAVDLDQEVNWKNRRSVQPSVLMAAIDKLTQIAQDLDERIDRKLSFQVSADLTGFSPDLPTPVASQGVAINSAGTGFEFVDLPAAAQAAAEAAQAAAEAANTSVQAIWDQFDDTYLGAKASAPTLNNDGDALTDGNLYFNTTDNKMYVYDLGTTTWLAVGQGVSAAMAAVVGAATLAAARTAMGVPGLADNNLFEGTNTFNDTVTLKAGKGSVLEVPTETNKSGNVTFDRSDGPEQAVNISGNTTLFAAVNGTVEVLATLGGSFTVSADTNLTVKTGTLMSTSGDEQNWRFSRDPNDPTNKGLLEILD